MSELQKISQVIPFPELPFYLTVRAVTEDDIVSVEVESTVHVEHVVKLPTQYSVEYVQTRPNRFRLEVLSAVVRRCGLEVEPFRYS